MKKIYLDISSITNSYFIQYIKNIKAKLYISELTLLELKSEKLYNEDIDYSLIESFLSKVEVLKVTPSILNKAKMYLKMNIVENEEYNDGLHIAIAKTYNLDTIIYDTSSFNKKNIDFNRLGCIAI